VSGANDMTSFGRSGPKNITPQRYKAQRPDDLAPGPSERIVREQLDEQGAETRRLHRGRLVVAQKVRPPRPARSHSAAIGRGGDLDFFCATPCTEVWGAYVHRNYILASDMNSGLWVFRVK
jgi:hypothetical protein